jgi:hypothetical protein
MTLTYTINENNLVHIYSDTQIEPIIIQPSWPNGTPWVSETEASAWAQLCIVSMEDRDAPYAPAGPGLEGDSKPSVTE